VALPEVTMAAAIGIPDEVKGESIALYVVPGPDVVPDEDLTDAVIAAVTGTMGNAFRPKSIRWVGDLPRTRSAKIMRRVIKAVAQGEDPGDLSGLENPDSLNGL